MSIRSRVAAALSLHYLVCLVLFVISLGLTFIAIGLYLEMIESMSRSTAAFVLGGGVFGLLLLAALVAWLVQAVRNRRFRDAYRVKRQQSQPEDFIESQLRPILGDRATTWARANPGLVAVGALSAGVVLAASPSLRGTLMRTVRPMLLRRGLAALTDDH